MWTRCRRSRWVTASGSEGVPRNERAACSAASTTTRAPGSSSSGSTRPARRTSSRTSSASRPDLPPRPAPRARERKGLHGMSQAISVQRARPGFEEIVGADRTVWEVETVGSGPRGRLPLTAEMLRDQPSGDIFGLTQNAGMGWDPRELGRPQYLMLSPQGGGRAADGRPVALGYHTGHWEVGLLMKAAAEELVRLE